MLLSSKDHTFLDPEEEPERLTHERQIDRDLILTDIDGNLLDMRAEGDHIAKRLGLNLKRKDQYQALAHIISNFTELALQRDMRCLLYYFRSHGHYAATSRHTNKGKDWYGLIPLTKVIDELHRIGVIGHHQIPSTGGNRNATSAIWMLSALFETGIMDGYIAKRHRDPIQVRIKKRIRKANGKMRKTKVCIDFISTPGTHRIEEVLLNYTEMMRCVVVTINHPKVQVIDHNSACFTDKKGTVRHLQLDDFSPSAIFTNDFNQGGRIYLPHQQVPKCYRDCFLINGEETAELDFASIHPTLVRELNGYQTDIEKPWCQGDEDVYAQIAFHLGLNLKKYRSRIKKAFNIRLNVKSSADAVRTIVSKKILSPGKARALMIAIEQIFPEVANAKTIIGLRLQALDAAIITQAIDDLTVRWIPHIPVHDSVIVQRSQAEYARAMMKSAYQAEILAIRRYRWRQAYGYVYTNTEEEF